ncbi:MAG: integrin alpha [Planctomycetota bacterium]
MRRPKGEQIEPSKPSQRRIAPRAGPGCRWLIALLGLAAPGLAQKTLWQVGGKSAAISAGDVNCDAFDDLIVSDASQGQVLVLSGADASTLLQLNGIQPGDGFGTGVAGAGDVNHDGYDDVIVGAPNDRGALGGYVRLYSGFDGSILEHVDGPAGAEFGSSVAGTGDVNQDGFDDFAIGAPGNGRFGAAIVYSGLHRWELFSFFGGVGSRFGHVVAPAGDVNQDGFDDIFVGAPGSALVGGSAVVLSGASGARLLAHGPGNPGELLGSAVAAAGDVDGDGAPDVIIGTPGSPNGTAEVLSGRTGGILLTLNGDSPGDRFGAAVAGVGDLDGDGRADLAVGAPEDTVRGPGAGSVALVSGATGTVLRTVYGRLGEALGSTVGSAGDLNDDGYRDVVMLAAQARYARVVTLLPHEDHQIATTIDGAAAARLGTAVCLAGDYDRDGFEDLAVGAPFDGTGGPMAGSVRIYSGQDGSELDVFVGGPGDRLGEAVATAGDWNDDGVADLALAAPLAPGVAGGHGGGWVQVISGADRSVLWEIRGTGGDRLGAALAGVGDIDHDGADDLLIGAPHARDSGEAILYGGGDGRVLWQLVGDAAGDLFGAAVAGGGDVDDDGTGDLIIGAFMASRSGRPERSGLVRLVSGATGGVLHSVWPDQDWAQGGRAVANLGDVNRDGHADYAYGAPLYDVGGTDAGRVTVLSGRDHAVLAEINGATPDAWFGFSLGGLGDLEADGVFELLVGAPGNAGAAGEASVWSLEAPARRVDQFTGTAGARMGWSVSPAGDSNGDGLPDFAFGAREADGGGPAAGRVTWVQSVADRDPGNFLVYGSPCSVVTPPLPRITGTLPRIGANFDVTLEGGTASASVFVQLLVGGAPLKASLGSIGANGCLLLIRPWFVLPVLRYGDVATLTMPVPAVAAFVGRDTYFQWAFPAPGHNPMGLLLSAAARARMGRP